MATGGLIGTALATLKPDYKSTSVNSLAIVDMLLPRIDETMTDFCPSSMLNEHDCVAVAQSSLIVTQYYRVDLMCPFCAFMLS